MKKFHKVIAVLAVMLTCAYPCTFMYFQNVGEGDFNEILIPLGIFLGVAAGITLIGGLILKSLEKAALFSSLFMLMFMNFNQVANAVPGAIEEYILWVFLALYGGFFLYLWKSKWNAFVPCTVIAGIFGGLILLNGVIAAPAIIEKIGFRPDTRSKLADAVDSDTQGSSKENVYYFIFDEYGGPKSLEYYYEFDNRELVDFLEASGFVYSKTSYNRESIATVDIVPNVLNLDYVTTVDGTSEGNLKYTENPALYQIFRNMGYQINLINHSGMLDEKGVKVISSHKTNEKVETLTDYILQQSLVHNIMVDFMPEQTTASIYAEVLRSALRDMKYAWREVEPDQPTLTVCYLQCPHVGFVFDSDGNRIAGEDYSNWTNKEHYINQLLFLNGWIKETVELIQKNDPGAIIVMQSDHGARYGKHCMYLYKEEDYDAELETASMQNILNCVYWGNREPADIEGLSGLNTWRTVLNVMFGTDLEMLEEPQGYVYRWRKVTGLQ